MSDLNQILKELDTEDLIWIISLFTSIFAIYSNQLERSYVKHKNPRDQKRFKTINITIGIISFFIYLYFLLLSFSRFRENNPNTSFKTLKIREANFVAASLIVIASVIYIITEILSDDGFDANILI